MDINDYKFKDVFSKKPFVSLKVQLYNGAYRDNFAQINFNFDTIKGLRSITLASNPDTLLVSNVLADVLQGQILSLVNT